MDEALSKLRNYKSRGGVMGQPRDPQSGRFQPDASRRELDALIRGVQIGLGVASLIVLFWIAMALSMGPA
jgi:hypothetical protein